MRSVAEHLNACLQTVAPIPPLAVDLANSVGCVIAEDIVAHADLPISDLAALDGYAASWFDLEGKTIPLSLPVSDDLGAGVDSRVQLIGGTTIRLASGAPIPRGTDLIIPAEFTDLGLAQVTISKIPEVPHIRKKAEDVVAGDVLMSRGERVGARQIALLAASGYGRLPVHPKPRVVVITVGSELVEPGEPVLSGQVFDADSHALATGIQDAGGLVYRVAAVPDETRLLREVLEDQLVRADLIITTGGLGYGENDTVKEALAPLGTVRFDNVAMSPGRQLGLGHLGDDIPVFCLPGNPIEALTAFEVFVRPSLRKMAGRSRLHRLSVRAEMKEGWQSPSGRRQFVCVHVTGDAGGYTAVPVGDPHRALMSSFARANAFAVVPEEMKDVRAGDYLPVILLDH